MTARLRFACDASVGRAGFINVYCHYKFAELLPIEQKSANKTSLKGPCKSVQQTYIHMNKNCSNLVDIIAKISGVKMPRAPGPWMRTLVKRPWYFYKGLNFGGIDTKYSPTVSPLHHCWLMLMWLRKWNIGNCQGQGSRVTGNSFPVVTSLIVYCSLYIVYNIYVYTEASFGGGGLGAALPKEKEKKKKKKKRKKKEKKKKREKRKKGTMNNVELLHIKCLFFQFFNSQVALKNKKKCWPPRKSWNDAPAYIILYNFI